MENLQKEDSIHFNDEQASKPRSLRRRQVSGPFENLNLDPVKS